MFRSWIWSVLRSSRDGAMYKLRGSRPSTCPAEESFRFFTPAIARHYYHVVQSLPKGHHGPHMRGFCSVASAGAEHREGLKLLVAGGTHARKAVGIWIFGSAAWVFSMVWYLGGVTRLTRSGLSMTDWKFTGGLPPLSDEEWLEEFKK